MLSVSYAYSIESETIGQAILVQRDILVSLNTRLRFLRNIFSQITLHINLIFTI